MLEPLAHQYLVKVSMPVHKKIPTREQELCAEWIACKGAPCMDTLLTMDRAGEHRRCIVMELCKQNKTFLLYVQEICLWKMHSQNDECLLKLCLSSM